MSFWTPEEEDQLDREYEDREEQLAQERDDREFASYFPFFTGQCSICHGRIGRDNIDEAWEDAGGSDVCWNNKGGPHASGGDS